MKEDLRDHPEAHSKITRKYKKQNGTMMRTLIQGSSPGQKVHPRKSKTGTEEAS